MDLSNLKPAYGANHHDKRLGRGQGSGRGGTSTRGHKGAKSRSGYKSKFGFEGGQMPLQRRLPKFGFKNPNRVEFKAINLDVIEVIATKTGAQQINAAVLEQNGIAKAKDLIKILGNGTISVKVTVEANGFSKKAKEAIEAAGGAVVIVNNKKAVAADK